MAERIRSFDWKTTPLGAIDDWPNSLKTAVHLMLASRYPMFVWWGPEFINLYNDAYIAVLGERHPSGLGGRAREIWSELWDTLGPQANAVLYSGESSWNEQTLLIMERYGYREETYFTFSYSPTPNDDGTIGGVFCACTEETERVLGERRLRILRQLAVSTGAANSPADACRLSANILAEHPRDIAFSLIYLLNQTGDEARLVASTGIEPGTTQSPELLLPTADGETIWPLREALKGEPQILRNQKAKGLPGGAWAEPVDTVVVAPLLEGGQGQPAGFLVAGVAPLRVFDDGYQGFFDLLAASIASSIAKARALEDARRQAEALAALDRAKTIFFSDVAHELRTPLTLMLGPIEETLEPGSPAPPEIQSQMAVAHRNGLRLLRLVNGMLDFSRIEAGRMAASCRPADLAALTSDLTSVFRSAIEKAGLAFIVDCPPLPRQVYVDRDMWEKIVLNLLSNALKFTFQGEIRVTLTSQGDTVELSVQDTGTGIPEDELQLLFQRFYRVAGARGRTLEGSGIGLALVQELAKLHGGSVSVSSEVGKGSEFRVSIPFGSQRLTEARHPQEDRSIKTSPEADAFLQEAFSWIPDQDSGPDAQPTSATTASIDFKKRGGRIVLADDNADMRQYIQRILGQHFEVEAVKDGRDALAAVQRQQPDLILADIMMPNLDGLNLLKLLRSDASTREIPIVLLSARTDEGSVVGGMEAGADDYLMKPFNARELLARVSSHLAIARIRQEAAESLRQSEEELARRVHDFDLLLRELPVGIAVATDPRCANIQVNPAFATMLGIGIEENASKSATRESRLPFRILRNGKELNADELPMQVAAREAREVRDFEADIVRDDGTTIRELCHAVPLFNEAGAVRGSLAVFVDITERTRAEEALRESEERFRNMAENAPVKIWVTDPDGNCTYINRRWREFTGTTLEQNLNLGWIERLHPEDRPGTKTAFLEANAARQPLHLEYRLRRNDGVWRWAVDTASPRFGEDGSYLGYIGSVIDLTDRKEMEHALRASEEQLALAQSAAGVGTWNWNPKTGESSFSGEYFVLHGLPRDHPPISYERWLSLVHPDDRERARFEMERALSETHSLDLEFRVVHPDGSTRWLAGKGTVFCDATGAPNRFTGVNYDITVRKLAENELVRSNEDLKQFAFAASHDLQEPLRVVVNYVQLLERRYKGQLDERAAKIIETTVGAAMRMESLLKGLRDYWQVSDRHSIQISAVDLNECLEKAFMNLQDAITENGAVITHDRLPIVIAAETPMIQVFQNLLANAIKYRHPDRPPRIHVTCEHKFAEYVISVQDNGLGIDPRYALQVFGIFRRLHGQEYSGAGIGLSICQKILERLGGRIWVDTLEEGSVFRFTIPRRWGQ